MKCQSCGEKEATVHNTEIHNGQVKEIHLCEDCAREKAEPVHKTVSLTEILATLLAQLGGKEAADVARLSCPSCGLSYMEFRTSGRLGCPRDYEIFEKGLLPLIQKIQYGSQHVGKAPPQADIYMPRQDEVLRLRRELERAVQREEYEKAARLRDRIRELTEHGAA